MLNKGGFSRGIFARDSFPFRGFFEWSPNHLFRRLKTNYRFWGRPSISKKSDFGVASIFVHCFQYFALLYFLAIHWLLWLLSFVVLVLDLWLLLLNVVFVLVVVGAVIVVAVVVVVVLVVALLSLISGCCVLLLFLLL